LIFAAWPPQKTDLEPSERKIDALGASAAPKLNPKAPHSTHVTAILTRLLQNRFLRKKRRDGAREEGGERGEKERRGRGERN